MIQHKPNKVTLEKRILYEPAYKPFFYKTEKMKKIEDDAEKSTG